MKHGTVYAYREAGCRCPECRAFARERNRRQRERRRGRRQAGVLVGGFLPVEDFSHGAWIEIEKPED